MNEGKVDDREGKPPEARPAARDVTPRTPSNDIASLLPAEIVAELRHDIRQLAESMLRSERPGHTLQPTAVLNELWIKLAGRDDLHFESREAFIAYAAEGIRHILVDHARRRLSRKRGHGWTRVSLDAATADVTVEAEHGPVDPTDRWAIALSELDEELDLLRAADFRSARVFELRFVGGMTNEQIATLLGVTSRTIRKDWAAACGWLGARLHARGAAAGSNDATHTPRDARRR